MEMVLLTLMIATVISVINRQHEKMLQLAKNRQRQDALPPARDARY